MCKCCFKALVVIVGHQGTSSSYIHTWRSSYFIILFQKPLHIVAKIVTLLVVVVAIVTLLLVVCHPGTPWVPISSSDCFSHLLLYNCINKTTPSKILQNFVYQLNWKQQRQEYHPGILNFSHLAITSPNSLFLPDATQKLEYFSKSCLELREQWRNQLLWTICLTL